MTQEEKIERALRKIAEKKIKKYSPQIQEQGERLLRKADIDPEMAAKSAAIVDMLQKASQGEFNQKIGNFDIGAKITPEEKAIKFGYKLGF